MASSASRGGTDRMIHQDYIARIRYSNALPPPPNPPKLLDIPNTGLSGGQYTTPGFASRLARDQPLNIEADAELGMPLDLVGMPGIFDGDESSIQAPLHPPVPHPHDRALLKPLSTLGKPKFSDSGVSFLRRTEYISSYTSKSRFDSTTSRTLINNTGSHGKKTAQNLDRESPEYIKSQVEKSFQIAASNLKDRTRIRHPTKRNLRLGGAHPLLPDLDAFPDAGGYLTVKFLTNPVPPASTYDRRLECSILRPIPHTDEEQEALVEAKRLHVLDPERNPAPDDTLEYEYFLVEDPADAPRFKRKYDVFDSDNDDPSLCTRVDEDGEGIIRFKRIRAYEQASQLGNNDTKYDEEVVIALHDGSDGLRQRAAYYYPLLQRSAIRPQRNKNIARNRGGGNQDAESSKIMDLADIKIADLSEEQKKARDRFKDDPTYTQPDGEVEVDGEGKDDEGETQQGEDADAEADEDLTSD
ncbi:hypothetical protein B7494_g7114 [Chlorociboria aeruginascens]|nr:hypothetical protein B7494_g7114 [Chlorociboria aeruginascens]